MTKPDYDNDLVFRSGGKEYARVDGNGEWKRQAPPAKFEISAEDVVAGVPFTGSSIDLRGSTEEIIRVDQEGFHYNGQFIADAGEAHRLMVAFLKQNTHQPEEIASEENERRLKVCLEQIRNLTHADLVKLMGEEWIEDYRRQFS